MADIDVELAAVASKCWRCHFFNLGLKCLAEIDSFKGCTGVTGAIRGVQYQMYQDARRHKCTCGLGVADPEIVPSFS